MSDFFAGAFVGFIASVVGSLIMWVVVGNYIVQRRIDKGIKDLGSGVYDDVIREATVKAVNSILEDQELKKTVSGMLHAYAMNFSKQATGMLMDYLQKNFGISQDQAQNYAKTMGGGGLNPDKLIGKLLDKFLGD